jgi:hypothetical protein
VKRWGLALLAAWLPGACVTPPRPEPVVASRTFRLTRDQAFASSAETLMDLGYTIALSDSRAGLLTGQTFGQTLVTLYVRADAPGHVEVRVEPAKPRAFWDAFEKRLALDHPAVTGLQTGRSP